MSANIFKDDCTASKRFCANSGDAFWPGVANQMEIAVPVFHIRAHKCGVTLHHYFEFGSAARHKGASGAVAGQSGSADQTL